MSALQQFTDDAGSIARGLRAAACVVICCDEGRHFESTSRGAFEQCKDRMQSKIKDKMRAVHDAAFARLHHASGITTQSLVFRPASISRITPNKEGLSWIGVIYED